MPQGMNVPLTQDWGTVNVGRASGVMQKPKTARGIDAAKASGKLATEKRCVAYCYMSCAWKISLFWILADSVSFSYLLFCFSRLFIYVDSMIRHGAGGNTSAHSSTIMSANKLDDATEVGTIVKVDKNLSKAIMQARTAKKMTQKELATAINEKPQVVAEYESGKAVPNPQIISKLERKLGCKLPRPGKSKAAPKAGATTTGAKKGATPAARAGITRGGPTKRR
jgi:putative transcription factor